ncbi:MAG: hypothetical protein MJA83_17365 [Gammaproteobacteria bacterium]|nr:hypothetical protein [Gammaproteobacteria bacterium]
MTSWLARTIFGIVFLFSMFVASAAESPRPALSQLKGTSEARAAAERMLETLGGKQAWGSDDATLITVQRVYRRSNGEMGINKIWRGLDEHTRAIQYESPVYQFKEYLGRNNGWRSRNGEKEEIPTEELQQELRDLRQSPYYVYRRLAKGGKGLTVELVEDGRRLNVYENDKILCWFLLDGKGVPYSWGNFYQGRVSQHFYGPLFDAGEAKFPRWGSAIDGSWRFEYIYAYFVATPVPGGEERK